MNHIKRVTPDELKQIYRDHIKEDFPRNERRPYFAMAKLMREGKYVCYGYYNGRNLLAYACYLLTGKGVFALLDYFAVTPELRGHGIGGEFLRRLREYTISQRGIFIEAEDPETAQTETEKRVRESRIRFYQSNGAGLTNSKCLLFGVNYDVLFMPIGKDKIPAEEMNSAVKETYREIYGSVYGRLCKPCVNAHG